MGPSDDIKALDTVAARELSEEEKELLNLYQHSFDDDKVDIELILSLVIKILSTSKEGMLIMKSTHLTYTNKNHDFSIYKDNMD